MLPPAPENLSNPVVRKAIHEVRRHIQGYIHKFGCKPDRVLVELARDARQSAFVRNKQLAQNRAREKQRKDIIKEYGLAELTRNQQEKAVKRVLLCREQKFRCAYCGDEKDIISENAADGKEVELDHIIPRSRGGNSYQNNLVLCHTKCNRGKGNKTPMEWLSDEEFGRLEHRLKHLKKENKAKWDNLHKEVPERNDFVESQLTDTAYASRQVAGWLEKTLYGDLNDGKRHVFATKGRYTAILRRDWGLFPDRKDGDKQKGGKNRSNHRHHAIDALVIALSGPERLSSLAKAAEAQELAMSEGYASTRREPISPPWGDLNSFRSDVMKEYNKIIVAHRPENRKITGALHNDTQLGPVMKNGELDTEHCKKRIFAIELSPNHLRVPDEWDRLREQLEEAVSKSEKKDIRSSMLELEDVKPTKSGVVRDRWFREELREYLRDHGLNVDDCREQNKKKFKKQIKELIKVKGIFLKSGVPVRRITLLRSPTMTPPVKRKYWSNETGKMEDDTNPKSVRLYEPQSNHHIEIRENTKGKWTGEVITNFEAAQRVGPSRLSGRKPQTAVNREDTPDGKFVMSLSIGEMVYMKQRDTKELDYFVIFKIDGTGSIHFTAHWDAGRSKATEKCAARQDIPLSAAQMQKLGAEPYTHPQKVRVGPLGDIKKLYRD